MQILLAEDDADEAAAILRVLRESRPADQVHWVKDGAEALDFLFCSGRYAARDPAEPPGIVLLDIKMPKIDGIEVLRRVKGSTLKAVPVAVLTSSSEERDVLESYRLGVDGYLFRPVERAALGELISRLAG
jgi:two-component system response regulator